MSKELEEMKNGHVEETEKIALEVIDDVATMVQKTEHVTVDEVQELSVKLANAFGRIYDMGSTMAMATFKETLAEANLKGFKFDGK